MLGRGRRRRGDDEALLRASGRAKHDSVTAKLAKKYIETHIVPLEALI